MAKPKMPPPGTQGSKAPGVAIVIAPKDGPSHGPGGRMPPPGTKEPKPKAQSTGAKVPEAQAIPVRADSHCVDCENYSPDSGECAKVEGYWQPDDACVKYFHALAEESDESPEQESAEPEGAPSMEQGA